jgi:malate permease and related proteins
MSAAAIKTISLLFLIVIGFLMRNKIAGKDQRDGIRTIILSLALPATIFIALLQIDFKSGLIVIPILSLAFNLLMHLLISKVPFRPLMNIPKNQYRVLILLIPSLAPGLSCFPFIMEYSGQEPLAMAALADVGNKIFVLIISYTIAMKWYFEQNKDSMPTRNGKIKDLLLMLINEPVNIAILVAIIMLSLGLSYTAFPDFARLSIDRLSLMMTPLVLLFIGISIRLTWSQFKVIFAALTFRCGIAFLISAVFLTIMPIKDVTTALLIVVFPQSACSFWPYAHMSAVALLEKNRTHASPGTFDLDFAMNVLACSMPLSVVMILIIYSSGNFFSNASNVFVMGGAFLLTAAAIVFAVTQSSIYKSQSMPEATAESGQ